MVPLQAYLNDKDGYKSLDIDKIPETYEQPTIEVLIVDSEGILCASGPMWEDDGGAWG